jgi:hypothetical protein
MTLTWPAVTHDYGIRFHAAASPHLRPTLPAVAASRLACPWRWHVNDLERKSIQPGDWSNEEGRGEAQKSLRSDVGVSMQQPKTAEVPDDGAAGAGLKPGRGTLGTPTEGDKGAEQGPR